MLGANQELCAMRLIVAAGLIAVCATAWAAATGPIGEMAGYWTGNGSVTLSGGNTERVKCAVIYKVSDDGVQIKQSIRCASTDYSINATADLKVKGEQVSGSWEEKTYSATGEVSGRFTGENLVLSIQGANFTASMNVSLSACKQSINISPKGLDVNRINIGLSKC
jgi:hypothetical protein